MYTLVLGTAVIVLIIGMAAVAALRVRRASAESSSNAAVARNYAQAAVEWGLVQINADSGWRTTRTGMNWVSALTVGSADISWKIVDSTLGPFGTDPSSSARLYGRAYVGDAVRLLSVEVVPDVVFGGNLLKNSGFEQGASDWTCNGACTALVQEVEFHAGTAAMQTSGRAANTAGPGQWITDAITSGVEYHTEVWVLNQGTGSDDFRIEMELQTSITSWNVPMFTTTSGAAGTWVKVSGRLTPFWFSQLLSARWVVISTGADDFVIDDAVLAPASNLHKMVPAAGTWRREPDGV